MCDYVRKGMIWDAPIPTKSSMTALPDEAPSNAWDQMIPRLKNMMRKNQNLRDLFASVFLGRANWYCEVTRHM